MESRVTNVFIDVPYRTVEEIKNMFITPLISDVNINMLNHSLLSMFLYDEDHLAIRRALISHIRKEELYNFIAMTCARIYVFSLLKIQDHYSPYIELMKDIHLGRLDIDHMFLPRLHTNIFIHILEKIRNDVLQEILVGDKVTLSAIHYEEDIFENYPVKVADTFVFSRLIDTLNIHMNNTAHFHTKGLSGMFQKHLSAILEAREYLTSTYFNHDIVDVDIIMNGICVVLKEKTYGTPHYT